MKDSKTKGLNLIAENPTEQRVLEYLIENASPSLIWKINTGKKTLAGALEYAKGEAKKRAAGAGCVCVDDDTVFGWIIHFFEEDEIKEPAGVKRKSTRVPGGVKKKPEPKAKKLSGPIVMDLFPEMQGDSQ